jgi:UDP-3-O-[3-hydroxymyristoyl] glucosamine N-acyltransferase
MISHDGREVWGSSAKRKSLDDRRVIVESGCTIHPSATLGDGVLVQAGAIISHDCVVGAFATICPGVVICGSVMVGEGVTVGAGATVRQGIIIGP